jgi:hypothetical protein
MSLLLDKKSKISENQLESLQKSLSETNKQHNGPAGIRIQDLHRVKPNNIENATISPLNIPDQTLRIDTEMVQDECLNDFLECF